jgi:hypothetical protein
MKLPLTEDDILKWMVTPKQKNNTRTITINSKLNKQQKHQKMNDKMMQLFKQFGITQFDFTSVKVTIGLMVYTGKTGNEYFFEVKNKNK